MKPREATAWILSTAGLVGLLVAFSIIEENETLRAAEKLEATNTIAANETLCAAEKHKAGEMLFECGDSIQKLNDLCTEESKAYMERGNLLFKCQEDMCVKNGWLPPHYWEELEAEISREDKELKAEMNRKGR